MNVPLDLAGRRFGRLVALELVGSGRQGRRWRCLCDCGKETTAPAGSLISGRPASCGCGQREAAAALCRARATHGRTRSRLYTIWRAMKARCESPSNISFARYGGRGIAVCSEWAGSFEAFSAWAVNAGYRDGLSIDRIDVDGDYEPGNCRWATPTEQANNRSSSKRITVGGVTRTLAEWSRLSGIKARTIEYRLAAGVPAEALFSPPRGAA